MYIICKCDTRSLRLTTRPVALATAIYTAKAFPIKVNAFCGPIGPQTLWLLKSRRQAAPGQALRRPMGRWRYLLVAPLRGRGVVVGIDLGGAASPRRLRIPRDAPNSLGLGRALAVKLHITFRSPG